MFLILSVFIFVLGLLIGSFLNVVVLRYNTGLSIKTGRSQCFSCGKTLHPLELFPVLSFLIQKGKCRGCKTKISWQYPLVELFTGFLFLGLFLRLPFRYLVLDHVANGVFVSYILSLIFYFVIFGILIVIMVYDLRHKIIPDGLVYTFIALSIVRYAISLVLVGSFNRFNAYDIAAGPILFIVFFLIWFLSKGRAMGFGDAKLVLGIGLFLGLTSGVSAVILAFWIGAVVGVALLFIPRLLTKLFPKQRLSKKLKSLTIKSELPFAPFLILGLIIVFFWHMDILHLGVLLSL